MDIIEKARELGLAIMDDERCKRLQAAKKANDEDSALQDLIGEFNLKKLQLNNEFNKLPEEQKKERLADMENELKEVYNKIMENPTMAAYAQAKKEIDELLGHINSIIQMSVSGEVDTDGGSCGGDCGSCAGCH